MKLVMAIVSDEDVFNLMDKLNEENFQVTKLASTGGFLRKGNTTVICGVDDERVEAVLDIIEHSCKQRTGYTAVPNGFGNDLNSIPVQVNIGGATIFVLNVDQFRKV